MAKTVGSWGKPAKTGKQPTDARAVIGAHLQPGEQLLWHARGSGLNANAGNIYLFVFLVFWCSTAYAGIIRAALQGDQNPVVMIYALLISTTVIVLLGGLGLRSLLAPAHETYGLTDRRVIIVRNIFPRHTTSYPGKDLDFILPGRREVRLSKLKRGVFHPIALIGIERPAEIAELIRTTLRPDLKLGQDPELQVPPLEPRRP